MTTQTPVLGSLSALQERDDLSSHLHRQLIGWVALTLPFLLVIIAGWRPTAKLQRWDLLDSISAYYYTGALAAFHERADRHGRRIAVGVITPLRTPWAGRRLIPGQRRVEPL